jgi:hypothetical protein
MKTKNIILSVAFVSVVVFGFVAYKAFGSLDKIIEAAIESYGPEIIGATVQLDGVSLNLSEGQVALNGLHIGNPEGYKTDYAMQVEQVKVTLDIESITSDIVIIKEVMIQGPSVIYEMASGGSNIDKLAENAQNYTGVNAQANEDSDDNSEPKLIIEHLKINQGQVSVSHSILKGKALSVGLPDIHLKDIGKDENGASPGEVAQEVMQSIKSGVGTAVASLGLGETFSSGAKAVKKGAAGIMDSARGAGDKLKGIFE